ncbi:MAG: glycosyltransferase family 39 protein [Elusimicrobia bacterium]|nr:glycosyltransferase family 39 protein [Elusimicrobiota bacterium]
MTSASEANPWPSLVAVLAPALCSYLVGWGWGLPSAERTARVLLPEQRSIDFFRELEANRRAHYERLGHNLQAAFGSGRWSGALVDPSDSFQAVCHAAGPAVNPVLMHGFSSFLLRSVEQDEQFVLNAISRINPKRLEFDTRQSLYGGAYIYPMAGALALAHVLGALRLVPDPLFYYQNAEQIAAMYRVGRLFSALCALGCSVLVYLIARRLYDGRVAWWTAALFSLCPAVNAFSHVMKPHLPAALLSLGCAFYCLRAAQEGRDGDWLKANVLFGLAVGSVKYTWVLIAPMWALFLAAHHFRPPSRALLRMLAFNAASVAVFFVFNPYVPFAWRDFLDEMRGMARWYEPTLSPVALAQFFWSPLRYGLSTGLWAAAMGGLAWALYRRSRQDKWALWLLAPWLLGAAYLVGTSGPNAVSARMFLGGLALLSMLAAAGLVEGLGRLMPRAARCGLAALWLGELALAGAYDANFLMDSPGKSNSFSAAEWIEREIPAGRSIGMSSPAPMLDRFPPIPFSRYELVFLQGDIKGQPDGVFPDHFVNNASWHEGVDPEIKRRYRTERNFSSFIRDHFTSANFPIVILSKDKRK